MFLKFEEDKISLIEDHQLHRV